MVGALVLAVASGCASGPGGLGAGGVDPEEVWGWVEAEGAAGDSGLRRAPPHVIDPLLGIGGTAVFLADPVTVYAVRHAEKDSGDDPGLTEEGLARAAALAERLAGVPLAGAFATDLRRTQETIEPTATAHGLPVITDVDPEVELAPLLLTAYAGESVVHAGHTYTLPSFFEGLGVLSPPDVDGYGQLFIVTASSDGVATLVETTYGEPEE